MNTINTFPFRGIFEEGYMRNDGILALYSSIFQFLVVAGRTAVELIPNEVSQILRIEDLVIAGKLMSMGILPQAEIELVRRNALGHTLIFRINSRFKIALRRDEAVNIIIQDK